VDEIHSANKPTCSYLFQTPSHARPLVNLSNVHLSNSVELPSLTFMLLTPSPICNAQIHLVRTNTTPDATMLVVRKPKGSISPNLIHLNRIKTHCQTRRFITSPLPCLSHLSSRSGINVLPHHPASLIPLLILRRIASNIICTNHNPEQVREPNRVLNTAVRLSLSP
jgi:hypothetical protein